jgi:ankyrin repeat protein
MPSDRVQRQIDRLLDQAEEAIALRQWEDLRAHCEVVLNLDPDNSDATSYIALADRSLAADVVPGRPDIMEAKDAHWWTLLHVIAHDSDFISGWFHLLIDHGADIEARTISGETPLHIASQSNSWYVAHMLIERGADIEAEADEGCTPLHKAAERNSLEVATLLIDHGADIEAKTSAESYPPSRDGRTPLQYATDEKSLEVARLLIDRGANTENIDLSWMD